jgi:polysaccharide deacetylase 2 family uncharacterized protein YibQ
MDDGPGDSKVNRNNRNTGNYSRSPNAGDEGLRERGGGSFKRFQFRLNPLRQGFFVVLAITGIAIGYGLGFLLKDEPAPEPRVAAKPMVASETRTENRPAGRAPAPSSAPTPLPLSATTRPYEEPLTQEVIENPAVTESPPEPQKPEPKPEMKKEPEPKPEPELEPKPLPVVVAAPKTGPKPKIVIVIDDLGIDKPRTARTISLPGPLTLSFLTYASDLDKQTRAARNAGHELWMHIPMEPGSPDVDPGPNVLLTGIPKPELEVSIKWNLEQFSGYVGINNHMGSRFTADLPGLRTVMEELKRRDLLFLDSVTSGKSVAGKAARETGVPFARRNVFLDHQDDKVGIERRLAEVERLALRKGIAIAIGHPRERTLTVLGPWLKGLEAKGFRLVPLSAAIKKP